MPIIGFEPGSSFIKIDRAVICATATARLFVLFFILFNQSTNLSIVLSINLHLSISQSTNLSVDLSIHILSGAISVLLGKRISTHHMWKDHSTTGLPFNSIEFDQRRKHVFNMLYAAKLSNSIYPNLRPAVQWSFPIWWVFSDSAILFYISTLI